MTITSPTRTCAASCWKCPTLPSVLKRLGLWARTLDGASGKWVQADRGARSNQTPFLAGEQNAAYLAAEPADDARFVPVFAHALEHAGGYTPAEATRVAGTLLPDVLHL